MDFTELGAQITQLDIELKKLLPSLSLQDISDEKERLLTLTSEPEFWSDIKRAQKVQQRIAAIDKRLTAVKTLRQQLDDLGVLLELASEMADKDTYVEVEDGIKAFAQDLDKLKLATLLSGEHDASNALLTLHSGAGGTEAQDWTEMLARMYARWAEQHDFAFELLSAQAGDEAGIKTVTYRVSGENAYGYLLSEHGIHRLVRISPFDSSGRRHT